MGQFHRVVCFFVTVVVIGACAPKENHSPAKGLEGDWMSDDGSMYWRVRRGSVEMNENASRTSRRKLAPSADRGSAVTLLFERHRRNILIRDENGELVQSLRILREGPALLEVQSLAEESAPLQLRRVSAEEIQQWKSERLSAPSQFLFRWRTSTKDWTKGTEGVSHPLTADPGPFLRLACQYNLSNRQLSWQVTSGVKDESGPAVMDNYFQMRGEQEWTFDLARGPGERGDSNQAPDLKIGVRKGSYEFLKEAASCHETVVREGSWVIVDLHCSKVRARPLGLPQKASSPVETATEEGILDLQFRCEPDLFENPPQT